MNLLVGIIKGFFSRPKVVIAEPVSQVCDSCIYSINGTFEVTEMRDWVSLV